MKSLGKSGDRSVVSPELLQHPTSGGVRERTERGIVVGLTILNHTVQYSVSIILMQWDSERRFHSDSTPARFSCKIEFVEGTLLFAILDYDLTIEPDTDAQNGKIGIDSCQWWISTNRSFMVTVCNDFTFRIIDVKESAEKMMQIAPSMLEKYTNGNPVKRGKITLDNVFDVDEVRTKCAEHGLDPSLFIYDNLIVFWRLGSYDYRLDGDGPTHVAPKPSGFLSKLFGKK